MPQTAYCSECKSRVQLTPDGLCPNGHGRPALRNIESAEDPAVSHDAPLANEVNSPRTGEFPNTGRKLNRAARLLSFAGLLSFIISLAVELTFSDMSPEVNAITDPISSALFYSVPILLTAAAILAVVANAPSRAKILRLLALVVAAGLTFWAGILLDLVPHGLVVSAAIVSFTPVFAADNPASRTRLIVASVVLLTVGLLIAPAANVDDLSSIGAVIILLFPVGLQCLMAVMGIEAILSGRA